MLSEPPDLFSRYHYDPGHVTAGAAVLSPTRDAVLLIHHKRLDIWIEPGGHVDPTDESPFEAAMRETIEETGVEGLQTIVDGLFDVDVHPIPAAASEPRHQHFNLVYAFVATSQELQAADEVHDARWQPLERIAEVTADKAVLRVARKLDALR